MIFVFFLFRVLISHFRVAVNLIMKAKLILKFFTWKLVFRMMYYSVTQAYSEQKSECSYQE